MSKGTVHECQVKTAATFDLMSLRDLVTWMENTNYNLTSDQLKCFL